MFKKIPYTLIFLLTFSCLRSEEIKAVWIARWNINEPLKVFQLIKDLQKSNLDINTLFVQVYARGEAMYNSEIVPRSQDLFNAPFAYDPLSLILELAHRNGFKVHAWLNLYYVWSQAPFPESFQHISNKHPEWFIADTLGVSMKTFSIDEIKTLGLEGYFLEPGNTQVREFLVKIAQEIVKNYDVDGIHMDYCRYPGREYGYDIPARVSFMRENYVDPMAIKQRRKVREDFGYEAFFDLNKRWDDWRRKQVTLTVRDIKDSVKAIKPGIEVSAAVIGDVNHASDNLFQDWVKWGQNNDVDFVVPMLYSTSADWLERQTKKTVNLIGREKVVIGLGAYLMDYKDLLQEILKVQGQNTRGYILFSYGGMQEKGYFK